jgi:hypothetical protein
MWWEIHPVEKLAADYPRETNVMGASHSSSGPSPLQTQRVGLQNQLGQQAYGTGQTIFGEVSPTLQGMLNNPVTPQERAAIFETAMAPPRTRRYGAPQASAFSAAAENAAQRAGHTCNPAGLLETDEQLARGKGQAMSDSAMKAEQEALAVQDQRRQDALRNLGQLYGINMQTLGRLIGGMPGQQSPGFQFKI